MTNNIKNVKIIRFRLALIESVAMTIGFKRSGYLEYNDGAMGVLSIILVVFALTSPSRCISSNFGIAIVRSCIMMDEVIYGVMFSANIDILYREPPVMASKKPKRYLYRAYH